MTVLNSKGEIADFIDESQFEGGESAFECVSFSAALIKYCGAPSHGPTGTGEQIDQLADYWYAREEGDFSASNTNGMSLPAEYAMLQGMGLHYHALPISDTSLPADDIANVKAWLKLGYPVMICGAEAGFFDMDMGDVVPYAWTPSGNHCIVACGIASDGNLLVRDTASIAPTGMRPGPRRYDASKMQLISGTAIEVPWLPSLPANFDPTKGGSMVPTGWHDDGTTLTAPNGVPVRTGFRDWVLNNNWDAGNWPLQAEAGRDPLEDSNPSLGGGTWQPFRWTLLEWTQARGVFEAWVGQELLYAREHQGTGLDPVAVKNRLAAISLAAQQAVTLAAQPIT